MAQTQLEEDLKYHAARTIWKKRDQMVEGKLISWSDWWEGKFGGGETYAEYVTRMKERKGTQ